MNRNHFFLFLALCITLLLPAPVLAVEVSRAQFTTAVENREPVDEITRLDINHARIYFFTEIRNGQGQTISHRWLYRDKVMAEVSFQIKGPRWRIWSSKNLLPFWTGTWTVQVVDGDGQVLEEKRFEYVE